MEKKFQLIVGSPLDYEELVVYIKIDEKYIALVQKEEGVDKMKVEFFEEKISTDIYLDVLLDALREAKNELNK